MTSGSAYTNLESLLLFQCLHAYGVAPSVFGRISDLLKKNPDISGHKHFQPGRLSPDALRAFYLDRLRRELEHEQAPDSDAPSGHGDLPSSRKRKLPPAHLPTVQESLQHQHLIPRLVTKLYASYRNDITEQIRAEEDKYEKLQRDLQSIERGEWDSQLKEKARPTTPATPSPTLPKKSPLLAQKPLQPHSSPQLVQSSPPQASQELPQPAGPHNGHPSPSTRRKQLSTDQRRPPATPQPLAAPPLAQNNQTQSPIPSPRFQQHPNAAYTTPTYPPLSPYPPGQQPQPGLYPNHAHSPQPQPPQIAPTGPQFPPQPMPPHGNGAAPQYGPPPGVPQAYSPAHQRFPPQPPPGQPPTAAQLPHQLQRGLVPQPGQPPYIPLQPQANPPPPQAGFMLPPFQVSPQDPSRVHQQATAPTQNAQANTPSNTRQQSRTNAQTSTPGKPPAPVHPLVIQARETLSTPTGKRSPLNATGTPLSAKSFWKRQSIVGAHGSPASPRPDIEPVDDFVPLSKQKQSPSKSKAQRKQKVKGKGKDKEANKEDTEIAPEAEQEDESMVEMETRSGRSRRRAATKRARHSSVASSRAEDSVLGRSRSHSILSHTETVAADNESQAGHQIKSERETPIDAIENESVGTPSHMPTRRRGTVTQAPPSTRRKRKAREVSLEIPEDQFNTPGPPRTIIAQRHFSKMCAPIMHDINSHKHASTFTTAVRAKDAEGYYDIIKRPTDLKSIQKAITNGAKQVAAAASDTPIGSPGGGGGVVELLLTSDHVPPESIVNAGQLEKELMRMFANALMFNPGEDGVVEDARQMFETVQRSVSNWRNVERGSGSGRKEVEDTPAAEEEEPAQASKRRKL